MSEGIRNCKKCGKLFNYVGGLPICPNCKEEAEKKFQDVKQYLRENPRSDIKEVSEKCGVDQNQIQQWIREERLMFSEDSPIKIPCEKCGALIQSGKYCNKCKDSLARGLDSVIDRPKKIEPAPQKKDQGAGMRFLGKN